MDFAVKPALKYDELLITLRQPIFHRKFINSKVRSLSLTTSLDTRIYPSDIICKWAASYPSTVQGESEQFL